MNRTNPLQIIIILAVTGLAAWYLYPSVMFYSKSYEQRSEILRQDPDVMKKLINLGLDLQGGMRLVLEVDKSRLDADAQKDILDRAYTVIENRINALGVAEPTIQKQGSERIVVELPGLSDEAVAKRVIGSTAQLEFNLLREPAELQRAIQTIDNVLKGKVDATVDSSTSDTASAEEKEAREAARRLFEGQSDDTTNKEDSAAVAKKGTASLSEYLVALGSQIGVQDKNKRIVDEIIKRPDIRAALERAGLGSSNFLWGHDIEKQGASAFRPLYYVKSRPELRGDIIKDASGTLAQGGMETGQPIVEMELNADGARKFSRVTAANVSKFLAIVLDSTVYSAPQIRQKISQGRAQITGSFTMEEAKGLAIVLRAGALPAPVTIIEERTVGPSLGQDSIRLGTRAGLIGALLIMIFMVVYYKKSGLYANLALTLNAIFVLAGMASINATLTLPGIAGIVLNLGMAVDANVLICERIREELAMGKLVKSAIEAGYKRVFVTIMDSNVTTLLAAIVLLWIGTGPIKGFAVTLIFGIVISMFTSLFVTRTLYAIFTKRTQVTLSI